MARPSFWAHKSRATGFTNPPGGGGGGPLIPFSFDEIPYTDPDIINPGRGAEQWHNSTQRISNPDVYDVVTNPTGNQQADENSFDVYYRKQWIFWERVTEGNYVWTGFDGLLQDAANNGQRLSFGIMPYYAGAPDDGYEEEYDGSKSSYPEYLHDYMQSAVDPDDRDFATGEDWWCPNWNSSYYLDRLRALHAAIYDHITTTNITAVGGPNDGEVIPASDLIYCIDIRGYGQWGEWHTYGITDFTTYPTDGYPGNQAPTTATFKEIIDAHTEELPAC